MFKRLLPDPFILTLLAVIALASVFPARGAFGDIVHVASVVLITLLFFFHGAKLHRSAIFEALIHWRLHLIIVGFTFIVFPLLVLLASGVGRDWLPPSLWVGMLFLAALPSTVQSSIAFTSLARGNVPGAIAAASASQLLGVILTPALVTLLANSKGQIDMGAGMAGVAIQIFVPFLAGHLSRRWIGSWVDSNKKLIGLTDRGTIVLAVYGAFSAAVVGGIWHSVSPWTLAILLAICLAILVAMLLATWFVSGWLKFGRDDRITILFCGTKKSLVQGVPMARILFPGPDVGLVILPLMMFHQLQLMACAWLARRFSKDPENVQ